MTLVKVISITVISITTLALTESNYTLQNKNDTKKMTVIRANALLVLYDGVLVAMLTTG